MGASNSLYAQFIEGWGATVRNSEIWRIGMVQGLSEGAMYTFVFMWVPTLLSLDPPAAFPQGVSSPLSWRPSPSAGSFSPTCSRPQATSHLPTPLRRQLPPPTSSPPLNTFVVAGTYATDI